MLAEVDIGEPARSEQARQPVVANLLSDLISHGEPPVECVLSEMLLFSGDEPT
jgi:hypothetical protein